jgi:hypothetical protein
MTITTTNDFSKDTAIYSIELTREDIDVVKFIPMFPKELSKDDIISDTLMTLYIIARQLEDRHRKSDLIGVDVKA